MDVSGRALRAIIKARRIGARYETWIAPKGMGLWTREQNAKRGDSSPFLQRVKTGKAQTERMFQICASKQTQGVYEYTPWLSWV